MPQEVKLIELVKKIEYVNGSEIVRKEVKVKVESSQVEKFLLDERYSRLDDKVEKKPQASAPGPAAPPDDDTGSAGSGPEPAKKKVTKK